MQHKTEDFNCLKQYLFSSSVDKIRFDRNLLKKIQFYCYFKTLIINKLPLNNKNLFPPIIYRAGFLAGGGEGLLSLLSSLRLLGDGDRCRLTGERLCLGEGDLRLLGGDLLLSLSSLSRDLDLLSLSRSRDRLLGDLLGDLLLGDLDLK